MHVNSQKPVLIPFEFRSEIERLSKAALMDMVWDYAFQIGEERPDAAMDEFRKRREIILIHRKNAKA